jgi:hypothetical protein
MFQKLPRMDLAGLPASAYITRLAARRMRPPGTGDWRLSPSGPLAQPIAIGFKKANANHVPYTNPEFIS